MREIRTKGLLLDIEQVIHMEEFLHELIAPMNSSCEENTYEPDAPTEQIQVIKYICMMSSRKDRYYGVLLTSKAGLPKFPTTHFLVSSRDPRRQDNLPIVRGE